MNRLIAAFALALAGQVTLGGHYVTLDMLDVTQATTARGKVSLNGLCTGGNMYMNGKVYWRGYGVAAPSRIVIPLGGGAASDCNCH